jgi:hypothetical protein
VIVAVEYVIAITAAAECVIVEIVTAGDVIVEVVTAGDVTAVASTVPFFNFYYIFYLSLNMIRYGVHI